MVWGTDFPGKSVPQAEVTAVKVVKNLSTGKVVIIHPSIGPKEKGPIIGPITAILAREGIEFPSKKLDQKAGHPPAK